MTTHRAAAPPPATPIADAITALKRWLDEWNAEMNQAATIDFRPLINAWHALMAWVKSLADRWEDRRNADLLTAAESTRQALQSWSDDEAWRRAINTWANRYRVEATA